MIRKPLAFGLCLFLCFGGSLENNRADWPVFRGNPQQTGVTPAALPDKLEVVWKYQTANAIEGTPAIAGDTVYIGSTDEHLYALTLSDGTFKWKYNAKAAILVGCAVDGGFVYVGDQEGKFHCVDGKTGEAKWVFDTESEREDGEPESSAPASHSKVGRNDPCPCGSGKKYKKCHGQ